MLHKLAQKSSKQDSIFSLIADFSDGNTWGEVLLQYDVNKGGSLSFTTLSHFLYPND